MKMERVLVVVCAVLLLATMVAVSLASGPSPDSPGRLMDGDAGVVNGPTFDSSILFPVVMRNADID